MCIRNLAAVLLVGVVAWLSAASNAVAAEPVFSDNFDNLAKWTKVHGSEAKLGMLKAGELKLPCMLLGNGVAKAQLPQAIEESFELSFRASHNVYRRGLWVALFNEEGTKGYGMMWDASDESTFHGQGAIAITKFELAQQVTWTDQTGTILTKRVESGHKAVGEWPPLITLKWDKASGTLTLSTEGIEKARIVDRSFGRFSRIYVRGNEQSVFAEMKLVRAAAAATRPPHP